MPEKVIGIDFDGTLAPAEQYYRRAEQQFIGLLAQHGVEEFTRDIIQNKISEAQKSVLPKTGFGAALQYHTFLTLGLNYVPDIINSEFVRGVQDITDTLRQHPIEYYADVTDFVRDLKSINVLPAIITKGEWHHQIDKVRHFNATFANDNITLSRHFIMAQKNDEEYWNVIASMQVSPEDFLMIGDSEYSDIQPVRAIGAKAIHVKRPDQDAVRWQFERSALGENIPTVNSLHEALPIVRNFSADQPLLHPCR